MFLPSIFAVALAAPSQRLHTLNYVNHNGVNVPFHYPKARFEAVRNTAPLVDLPSTQEDHLRVGHRFMVRQLGLDPNALGFMNYYTDKIGTTHIYCSRYVEGVPITNNQCAIHVKDGQVVSWSSSFNGNVNPAKVMPKTASITIQQAAELAQRQMNNLPVDTQGESGLEYVELPDGTLAYAYHFEMKNQEGNMWFKVYVDANSGQVIHAVDHVKRATYKVMPWNNVHPFGRWPFKKVENPEHIPSSPLGWHSDGENNFNDTRGNNIFATYGRKFLPADEKFQFLSSWNRTAEPYAEENAKTATIQAFYVTNMVHDISYQYGFNEEAGNFQVNNFEKGGKGGDPVIVYAQKKNMRNNAYFTVTPDGVPPTINLFFFDLTKPMRDSALCSDIIIHEYAHGISNRMTGGPHTVHCLAKLESGGLGEGWSDAIALFFTRKGSDTKDTDYVTGTYAIGQKGGIRNYPYSTNMKVNPLKFSHLNKLDEVHDIGELWATVLNDVYWIMVEKYGFGENIYDATQTKGNIILLNLIFQGFANQPCNPTFLQARDAIILSDKLMYKGKYKCDLWKGFARRGMGVFAMDVEGFENNFELPEECQ